MAIAFADLRSYDAMKIELVKAGLSILVAIITLALTWLIGQRLASSWAVWQKRREFDISASNQFYSLYGEFLAVWRLWKVFRGVEGVEGAKPFTFPIETRFDLLKRASVAEGNVEALFLKLAAEHYLADDDIKDLGLFRQAYQQLRQHIRDDLPMNWAPSDPEYQLTKELAAKLSHILAAGFNTRSPSSQRTVDALAKITGYRSADWDMKVQRVRDGERSGAWNT